MIALVVVLNPGQKTTGQKNHRTKDHQKCQPRTKDHTDKKPPGQKATKLVFLRKNLNKSPDCVFFYSKAGEKMTKMTLSVFVAV